MSLADDRIKFDECPVCSSTHEYVLEVKRKAIQVVLAPDTEDHMAVSRTELVFVCPEKNREFQKEVTLIHRPYEYIASVDVKPAEGADS